jgi:hypothetical protein
VTATGIWNDAPWHAEADPALIDAPVATVNDVVVRGAADVPVTVMLSPSVLRTVTPAFPGVHPGAPSTVIAPSWTMAVTVTGAALELCTVSRRFPALPGTRLVAGVPVAEAIASARRLRTVACAVPVPVTEYSA